MGSSSSSHRLSGIPFLPHTIPWGILLSLLMPEGTPTSQYEYDLLGRLKKKINPDLTEREAVYDDVNNVVTIYDELDHFTKKYFDKLGRLIKVENAEYAEEYTYNYQGMIETKTDPLGRVYTNEYDESGRPLYSYNPDNTFKRFVYNNKENTVEVYDEKGGKKEVKYDWDENVIWVKDYTNGSFNLTEYQYNDKGNLMKMKDAKGNTTFYEYGLFGVERILYPDSSEEYLVYDCVGNVIEKTTGQRTIKYHYNAASQLIQIEYPDFLVSFTYDENGNRTAIENPQSTAVYVYDSRNRLSSETKTVDGAEYTTSYAYDAVSHLISTIYPDGTVVEQNYDDVGRVTSVNGYATYFWNETQLLQIQYANGVITDYDYDTRGRPTHIDTEMNGNDLLNLTYAYDSVGNVLQMKNTEIVSGQQITKEQWDYKYDSLNRLLTAAGDPSGQNYSLNYQYDSMGNRTQLNDTAYTYNEMNELISSESANETWTFTYDEYGNCTGKSNGVKTFEYLYDFENRLTAVKVDGQVTEEYTYDSDGNRIKKIDANSERVYIYSGANILYEVNKTTQMDAVYVYGPTGRIAKKVNDMKEYYHTDQLGSTKLVTSENGAVTEEIQYEPFGEQINVSEERYTYNGKERDETGLYYYGARYYDPQIGRFLTRDPLPGDLLSPQTLNSYVYCLNNPLRYVDSQGMTTDEVPTYPDGTYSSVLAELYKKLQQALNSMSAEDWAYIEGLLNSR